MKPMLTSIKHWSLCWATRRRLEQRAARSIGVWIRISFDAPLEVGRAEEGPADLRCSAGGSCRQAAADRRIITKQQHDQHADEGASGEKDQPGDVAAGMIPQQAERLRP